MSGYGKQKLSSLMPGESRTIDPRSKENAKIIAMANERIDFSSNAKREIEREALQAYRQISSHLNVSEHPWPVPVFDPVLHSIEQSRLAKISDAIFSNPPPAEYFPANERTSPEAATSITSLMNYHQRLDKPRRTILNGCTGTSLAGTQVYGCGWNYQTQWAWYWKRVPLKAVVIDPFTQQASTTYVEAGKWKYVRTRRIINDNVALKTLHITAIFPDTTVATVEAGEWFGEREILSERAVKERAGSEGWNKAAVRLALDSDAQTGGDRMRDTLDWQREIGLQNVDQFNGLFSAEKRKAIEVFRLYKRVPGGLELYIILNRTYVAWAGPSPYGHGKMPYFAQKCYHVDGQFWGLSEWRVIRYLLRAVQALKNAAVAEAVIGAMPPLLIPESAEVIGKRWAPQAEWYLHGCSAEELKFLQPTGQSRQIAQVETDSLMARIDAAVGSSDTTRGAVGDPRQKATTVNLAAQMAGIRDKYFVENLAEDLITPWYEQAADLMKQFQNANVQAQATGDPGSEPMTIRPDDFRDGDFMVQPLLNAASLKELDKKRALEVRHEFANDPTIEGRELTEWVLGKVAPEVRDKLMKPLDLLNQQLAQQGLPPAQQSGGGMGPDPAQNPFAQGDSVGEMASDLAGAFQS